MLMCRVWIPVLAGMVATVIASISLAATAFLLLNTIASAQITSSRSSNDTSTPEIFKAQDAVNNVLAESGRAFNEGLLAYEDNKLSEAGAKFNKAVEVFLYSTLNIQREPKLQNCYNQLIETIYRIEFPSETQLPQVKNLAQTCSWNIDANLADKVAMTAKASLNKSAAVPNGNTVAANTRIVDLTFWKPARFAHSCSARCIN